MKYLYELIELHEKSKCKYHIENQLLDGYLLTKNIIARNVRKLLIECNYSISEKGSSAYNAWPLMALDYFLEKKEIPYNDNVSIIKYIERKNPKTILIKDLEELSRPNTSTVIHESCHAIADTVLNEKTPTPKNNNEVIFRGLVGESMANGIETFVSLHSETKNDIFITEAFHSLIHVENDIRNAVSRLKKKATDDDILSILIVAFLLYNLLAVRYQKNLIFECLYLLGIETYFNDSDLPDLEMLFNHTLRISNTARVYTAMQYQYFTGINNARLAKNYIKNLNFNIKGMLMEKKYIAAIKAISTAITSGERTW